MRKTAIEAGKYSWRVVRNRKDSALIAVIAALISSVLVPPSFAQFSVPTSHGDNARTGANTNETLLKPDNIDKNNFGRLLSHTIDHRCQRQCQRDLYGGSECR